MNRKKFIGLGLLSALIIANNPTYAGLEFFGALQTDCINALGGMEKVNEQLLITDADGVKLSVSVNGVKGKMTTPGIGLKKLQNPGGGACCLFDDNHTLVDKRMETGGNSGCEIWKNMKAKMLGKRLHSGIWWCTGPQANCYMHWWYQ